ncbi:MAG: DUF1957 domain-containing protein [Deltaproteobacteria bacterium]|nr:MAG: DUF1957 domain-containing protein [Deltaproteobacteria bacterium]
MVRVFLLLHTHIPYVKGYGRWPHGEEWLFEALLYSYIPLFEGLLSLEKEGWQGKVLMSFTPVLLHMLGDEALMRDFLEFIREMERRAEEDERVFSARKSEEFARLAHIWRSWFERRRRFFEEVGGGSILLLARRLAERGIIEPLASAATHAYLPLLSRDETVADQVRIGFQQAEKVFGERPSGFWLPECGYRPSGWWENPVSGEIVWRRGIDEFLAGESTRYTFMDPSVLTSGEAGRKGYGLETALRGEGEGASIPAGVFGNQIVLFRDVPLGQQVWSRHLGYPGDEWYLEFHKKHEGSGIRYWRVTDSRGDLGSKLPYVPEKGEGMALAHSSHFLSRLLERGRGNFLIAFDTELFGHWWFEGPLFLSNLLKKSMREGGRVSFVSPATLEKEQLPELEELNEGSWGEGGGHGTWLNEKTRNIWKALYEAEGVYYGRVAKVRGNSPLLEEVKGLAWRELHLMASSDWTFLITTGQGRDYGWERFWGHYENFCYLTEIMDDIIKHRTIDGRKLAKINEIKRRDEIFR